MTTARQVATRYGLTTADTIAPPKPKAPEGRDRWSPDHQEMFDAMGWAAVYFAGNEGPEPRFFGDNAGAWPILFGITESWKDNVSRNMDRMSPLKERGMLFRAWTPSYKHARQLTAFIEGYVCERIDQGSMSKMRGPWKDFGPETDLGEFEKEIHALAARKKIVSLSDSDFLEEIGRRVRDKHARMVERRGPP